MPARMASKFWISVQGLEVLIVLNVYGDAEGEAVVEHSSERGISVK